MNSTDTMIDACDCIVGNMAVRDIGGFCTCDPMGYFEWTNTAPPQARLECDGKHLLFWVVYKFYSMPSFMPNMQ